MNSYSKFFLSFPFLFFFFWFLGPHPWHMKYQTRDQMSCSCRPTPQPQPLGIQATSVIYTTAQSNTWSLILNPLSRARDWTHILIDTSWICFHWATTRTPKFCVYFMLYIPNILFQISSGIFLFAKCQICGWTNRSAHPTQRFLTEWSNERIFSNFSFSFVA